MRYEVLEFGVRVWGIFYGFGGKEVVFFWRDGVLGSVCEDFRDDFLFWIVYRVYGRGKDVVEGKFGEIWF